MADFEFIDNSDIVLEQLAEAIDAAAFAIGAEAETYAKKVIKNAGAVDTGRLRNSITFATRENEGSTKSFTYTVKVDGKNMKITDTTVIGTGAQLGDIYIGTNVEYAAGIETGSHRKAGAVNFLRRACTENSDRYKKLLKMALENA